MHGQGRARERYVATAVAYESWVVYKRRQRERGY